VPSPAANAATDADGVRIEILKADQFGCVLRVHAEAGTFVRRDLACAPWWLRPLARALAAREARMLRRVAGLEAVPQLRRWNGRLLERSYLEGMALYQCPPRGDVAWFRAAHRLLRALHARGVVHNDLAKEANWLVLADGRPGLTDFQLAMAGAPRARWLRLLAREDLRHLLKHKRSYCPAALTPVERRLLARPSWLRRAWFASGKRVYRFITRRVLHWRDNEGRGPRP
jgi:RIO-like serine/threonine protein kinase